jgi:hypothetical protein
MALAGGFLLYLCKSGDSFELLSIQLDTDITKISSNFETNRLSTYSPLRRRLCPQIPLSGRPVSNSFPSSPFSSGGRRIAGYGFAMSCKDGLWIVYVDLALVQPTFDQLLIQWAISDEW